jgi:hypothetical protein
VAVWAAVGVVGCGLLAGCGGGGGAAQGGPRTDPAGSATATVGPSGAASAAAGAVAGRSAAPGPSAGASSGGIDPCKLLTPAEGRAILHKSLGAGRRIGTGDLSECAYSDGPLMIAVLKSPYTKQTFRSLVSSQDGGGAGKATAIPGLGEAAFAYGKTGIIEVLAGDIVVSVTSPATSTSEAVAHAVLAHL